MATNRIVRIGVKANLNKQTALSFPYLTKSSGAKKVSHLFLIHHQLLQKIPNGCHRLTRCPKRGSLLYLKFLSSHSSPAHTCRTTGEKGKAKVRHLSLEGPTHYWLPDQPAVSLRALHSARLSRVSAPLCSAVPSLRRLGPSTGGRRHLVMTPTDREADDYSEDLLNSTQTINIICPLSTVDFAFVFKILTNEWSDDTNRQRSSKMFPDCWSIVVSSWCHLAIPIDREADHSADLV